MGVLCLAASVATHGHFVTIVDLDRIARNTLTSGRQQVTPDVLFTSYVDALASPEAQLFGFSSICSSYPLTIRLAKETKRLHPDSQIVFGGPQASAVDIATLEAFSWVDLIIRGEADLTFPALIDALEESSGLLGSPSDMNHLAGITFRRNGKVFRNINAPLIADLDLLPIPAYEFDPGISIRKSAHLELGRGCPYCCTFCSTNDYFQRKFRLKSPSLVLKQMRALHEQYGVVAFTLVHDAYTLNRDRVVEFAEMLIRENSGFQWSCSARTDRVDRELLRLMAESGCSGIFFGIESGSTTIQNIIKKRLDLKNAWKAIRVATDNRMKTGVSLIIGFPEETRDDLRNTVHFFVRATKFEHAEPQISLLAPLAETPIEKRYRGKLMFDHLYSNISHQGWREDPNSLYLIKEYPQIFPNFYSVPSILPRTYLKELHDFVHGITLWSRWLPIALLDSTGDFLYVFDEWIQWLKRAIEKKEERYPEVNSRYYCTNTFVNHILTFVAEAIKDGRFPDVAYLRNILEYERVLFELSPVPTKRASDNGTMKVSGKHCMRIAQNVVVRSFAFDASSLLRSCKDGEKLQDTAVQSCTVAFVVFKNRPVEVRQLPNRAADLLSLCDGKTTVEDVIERYCDVGQGTQNRELRKKEAMAGLMLLYEDGILEACQVS